MATLDPNSYFQGWILDEREFLLGSVLTTSNKQVIQNLIVQAAQEKVNLTFDPANPHKFMQREAELQGTIKTLQTLLDNSASAEIQVDPGLRQIHIPRNPQE